MMFWGDGGVSCAPKAQGSRDGFTDAELSLFRYFHGVEGSFKTALHKAFQVADPENADKLRRGFPDEYAAWMAWIRGDLYERAERAGWKGLA